MRQIDSKLLVGATLVGFLLFSSCQSPYKLKKVSGSMIAVNSAWDTHPNESAVALLSPYKASVDSMMYRVVGTSEMTMKGERPEGLLSNLTADVLRESAVGVLGQSADVGVINIGGVRNILTEGPITCGDIYEILLFENSLCVLTVKGEILNELFESIASVYGQGVSGIHLDISKEGKLLHATIGGEAVDPDRLYTVATIDYLADGNDGMAALVHSEKKICPPDATLRGLFMAYIEKQTQAGKKITS